MSFPPGSPAWRTHLDEHHILASDASMPVHPTQLYESIGCFVLAAAMLWFYHHKRRFNGQVFWLFAMGYAVLRYVVELFRADARGEMFGLSTSQAIGVFLFVTSIIMMWRLKRLPQTDEPVPWGWKKPSGS